MEMYRQGDVLVRRIRSIPKTAKPEPRNGPIILALGEVTGHKHAIEEFDKVDVFVGAKGEMYLRVKETAPLVHEEHGAIALPVGDYDRVVQREYEPVGVRNVTD